MQNWGYVFLCLLLPLGWGIVSARVFDRFQAWQEKRRPSDAGSARVPDADDREMYYI